jgi:hypothetical protein
MMQPLVGGDEIIQAQRRLALRSRRADKIAFIITSPS